MKPWAAALAAFALVLVFAAAAGGFGLLGWTAGLLREPPRWNDLPPVVLRQQSMSIVEFGLLGVILILLGILTAVLARGPYSPQVREREARDARMVQDLFRGLASMEDRLETLESLVLQRAGRLSFGRKSN